MELQTQVQQLLDMVQRLQSTLDAQMGVLQHLAEQTADEANQMTTAVNALQQKLNTQNDATGGKLDTVSGQVQSLNDSVDELKARIAKLDKTVQDLQTQMQNMQAPPAQAQPGGAGGAMSGAPVRAGSPAGAPPGTPAQRSRRRRCRRPCRPACATYNAGRYRRGAGEFQDVVHYYPLDDLAGTAQFYLGEIAYQQKDYADAISDYNAVLEGFSGNAKAPAAQLHKGLALLADEQEGRGHSRTALADPAASADAGGARSAQQAERDGREDYPDDDALRKTGFRFQVSGFRFQVSGFRFWVLGFRFQLATWVPKT